VALEEGDLLFGNVVLGLHLVDERVDDSDLVVSHN
jgi:hypothetical protein